VFLIPGAIFRHGCCSRASSYEEALLKAAMSDDFLEAILIWNTNGPSEAVLQWLQKRGLRLTPMKAGLLIAGTKAQFAATFSVGESSLVASSNIPVPEPLRNHVLSIGIPKPRQPYT
jgi:hypothetical protein